MDTFEMKGTRFVDFTGCSRLDLVKWAYELSAPKGLGFLAHESGPLPEVDALEIIGRYPDDHSVVLSMDYVKGRAVKFNLMRRDIYSAEFLPDGVEWYAMANWFDHSDEAMEALYEEVMGGSDGRRKT